MLILLRQNRSDIEICDAEVVSYSNRLLQQSQGFFRMVAPELDISEISKSLRIFRIDRQLVVEFNRSVIVLARLPVQIAQAEVQVGLFRRNVDSRLEFGNRLWSSAQSVQRFTCKGMCSG